MNNVKFKFCSLAADLVVETMSLEDLRNFVYDKLVDEYVDKPLSLTVQKVNTLLKERDL